MKGGGSFWQQLGRAPKINCPFSCSASCPTLRRIRAGYAAHRERASCCQFWQQQSKGRQEMISEIIWLWSHIQLSKPLFQPQANRQPNNRQPADDGWAGRAAGLGSAEPRLGQAPSSPPQTPTGGREERTAGNGDGYWILEGVCSQTGVGLYIGTFDIARVCWCDCSREVKGLRGSWRNFFFLRVYKTLAVGKGIKSKEIKEIKNF